jgi:hypothetical protein
MWFATQLAAHDTDEPTQHRQFTSKETDMGDKGPGSKSKPTKKKIKKGAAKTGTPKK